MRLFDVLTPAEYDGLKSELPVTADPGDLDILDFSFQYKWLGEQLRMHVALNSSKDLIYPRIAYCPDLGMGMPKIAWKVREGNRMISQRFCVVEFDLPEEQILLFDDSMWLCALNDAPIAASEADEENLMSPEAKIKSWERMFDMNFPDAGSETSDPEYWEPYETKYLCGAYWQLTADQVKGVSWHYGKVKNPRRVFYNGIKEINVMKG